MKSFHFPLSTFILAGSMLLTANVSAQKATLVDALDANEWNQSVWISAANAPVIKTVVTDDNFRAADGASWFLSTVTNKKAVTSARWMTTSLGVNQLFVNGKAVGEEYMKPGFTHWQKTRRSFTYDVTPLFNKTANAKNTLSAQVTPGWWADKIITPAGTTGMFGKKPAFRGVLELTFSDGTKQIYGTDLKTWKAGIAGPVTHAAIYDGEEYDARIKPGYQTPQKLSTPEQNTEFKGEILPTNGAEIYLRNDLAMKPVEAYTWKGVEGATNDVYGKVIINHRYNAGEDITLKKGETLVIDFGQNAAAVPFFTFKAKLGTVLTCLPAELLNDSCGAKSRGMDGPEGSVHRLNLRIPDLGFHVRYTFGSNNTFVSYHPTCTFFGYRFVSVTATNDVVIRSITSVPVTSIAKNMQTGTITTGNADVNKIISNTLWGQYSNYLSVPTDCPQRNERLGWTADTQVFTETGTFFANTDNFFHKWTRDMRDTQTDLGGYPGVAPIAQYGAEPNGMMRVGWADAGVIVPWTIWKQFGDKSIIDENWDSMDKFITHVAATKYDHNTLIAENGGYQYADWLSYEPLESCGGEAFQTGDRFNDKPNPKPEALTYWNYLCACYWVIDAEMMRDMAKATGRDVQRFNSMVDEARQYAQQFLNADGTFKLEILNTMQTPALFALKNGLVEGEVKDNMIARLRQNFQDHGNCLQTGFLGTSILMPTLSANGMGDIAYTLLLQHKNPSWLYSIDNGATTMWERWNSYMKDKGMGPRGMNSFNHYAYGCVCQWIWENAAGIAADPAQPGFKHIILAPQPDKRLGSIKAEYNSAAGVIKSAWSFNGDQWTWRFTIPQGATAAVKVPGYKTSKDYPAGTYELKLDKIK